MYVYIYTYTYTHTHTHVRVKTTDEDNIREKDFLGVPGRRTSLAYPG